MSPDLPGPGCGSVPARLSKALQHGKGVPCTGQLGLWAVVSAQVNSQTFVIYTVWVSSTHAPLWTAGSLRCSMWSLLELPSLCGFCPLSSFHGPLSVLSAWKAKALPSPSFFSFVVTESTPGQSSKSKEKEGNMSWKFLLLFRPQGPLSPVSLVTKKDFFPSFKCSCGHWCSGTAAAGLRFQNWAVAQGRAQRKSTTTYQGMPFPLLILKVSLSQSSD